MGDRPANVVRTRQSAVTKQQPLEQLYDTHPEVSLEFVNVSQAADQK